MDIFIVVLGVVCVIIGIIGSILPALPGPPVAYLGLWIVRWSGEKDFSNQFMIWSTILLLIVLLLDYVLPPYITKSSGGSKYAATGSVIGMIAGLFLTPIGIIAGMLLGAFLGELFFARQGVLSAAKAAVGAFVGFILGTGIKLLYCFFILYYIIF